MARRQNDFAAVGECIADQRVHRLGQIKIFLAQATNIMCAELNLHVRVRGIHLGVMVLCFGQGAKLGKKGEGAGKTVKLQCLVNLACRFIQGPSIELGQLLHDLGVAESHGLAFQSWTFASCRKRYCLFLGRGSGASCNTVHINSIIR